MDMEFDQLELDTITPLQLKRYLRDKFVVVASNRGPVEFRKASDGRIKAFRGAGGVVTAMSTALTATDAIWLSAARTAEDRRKSQEAKRGRIGLPEHEPQYWVKFVTPEKDEYEGFYNSISNNLLWYMQHYMWNVPHTPVIDDSTYAAWVRGYRKVNRLFAERILEEIRRTDKKPLIFLQDYHLYLCAHYIRRREPDVLIHHFTHSPWTQPDYLRLLPLRMRKELMQGILANDIVGFHTPRYASNFIWCCQEGDAVRVSVNTKTRTVYYAGREVLVRHYPISIDHETLKKRADSADVRSYREQLRALAAGRKLLVRVDRIELSKNIVRGLLAYRAFLREYPEWRDRVMFANFIYPSRETLKEYRDYRREVEELVRVINDEFGSPDWVPVYMEIGDNYPRSLAGLMEFDVLLVNPVFDGMNLVAKEGAAVNERNGLVLLSVNAGAYMEMRETVLAVNPLDVQETAAMIQKALAMPARTREKMARRAREVVEDNTSFKWLLRQIQDLRRVERTRAPREAPASGHLSFLERI